MSALYAEFEPSSIGIAGENSDFSLTMPGSMIACAKE